MGIFSTNNSKNLLKACKNNDIRKVSKIMIKTYDSKSSLNTNIKDNNGNSPILYACTNNNTEIVEMLIRHARVAHTTLELNEKNKHMEYPLLMACCNKNVEMLKLLIDYANENNIILDLNGTEEENNFSPLFLACLTEQIEIIHLLFDYSNEKKYNSGLEFILELNEKDSEGYYPILMACYAKNIDMVQMLIDYASRNNILLELNEIDDEYEAYPLLVAIENKEGVYPLLSVCKNDNSYICESIIEYANNYNISLELNDNQNEYEAYPIMMTVVSKNMKLTELLMKYAYDNEIILKLDESDIYNISEIPDEIIELFNPLKNFTADEYDELDIKKKNEILIVTNWKCEKDGWVYGHRQGNEEEKGLFPKNFIKICKENDTNTKGNNNIRNEITPEYRVQFDKKVNNFRQRNEMKAFDGCTELEIKRDELFYTAFTQVMKKSPKELKKKLKINYVNEEGIDAGGLLRDFFFNISKEIGNPNYSLFKYSNDKSYELEINSESGNVNPDHLNYFKFVGRIMGLAIFHKQYLSVNFTLLLYKKILNKPLGFSDMEFIDPEVFKNLKWLKYNINKKNE
eukprot:jgi/Orpsp1_1/1184774/evm.model.c7180000090930.1